MALSSARVAFIGVGAMGSHMAANLLKAGAHLSVFDAHGPTLASFSARHPTAVAARSAAGAAEGCSHVVTMLPSSPHVRAAYEGGGGGQRGILDAAPRGALLVDCSTVAPDASMELSSAAATRGLAFLDAPVSGGVGGAEAGTLTFMCGGDAATFESATPLLRAMGKSIVRVGGAGAGTAAKLCNNLVLGASMLAVAEAFALGRKLGVEPSVLASILNSSSGRCWASEVYSPVPGLVPTAPASRGYTGGFATALMVKDLTLALDAARGADTALPATAAAVAAYALSGAVGGGARDFSAVYELLNRGGAGGK